MRNLRLHIAYDGADFCGWQYQPQKPTIQGCLEEALTKTLGGERVRLIGSGRTDAGVHAAGQVANFRTECPIPCENLRKALNDALPPTIRVLQVLEAPLDFHARYDARAKTYRYRILQAPVCPPFLSRFVYHEPCPLNHRGMAQAAKLIEGRRDFASFAASDARSDRSTGKDKPANRQSKSNIRTVFSSCFFWKPQTKLLTYEVRADGFLQHMVRNIVGTLLLIGRGRLAPEDILNILIARDRSQAGPTAPAQGLWLIKVEY
jgi:tRNA pseudouridine38-40 synthase